MKIDHIELFVPDPLEAAKWYARVLGFEVVQEHADWAQQGGPLMISNDGGQTMLALFEGVPQGDLDVTGYRRVAFRVTADRFVEFIEASASWRTPSLTRGDVIDHLKAFSVYFRDPYGNLLEVTSYDHADLWPIYASEGNDKVQEG